MSKKWGSIHSWDIRGVFTEYSWGIRMYRVCVGYVSGMCRESVGTNGMRGGSSLYSVQDNLHNEYIINNLNQHKQPKQHKSI